MNCLPSRVPTRRRFATALRFLSLLLAFTCFWSFAAAGVALAASPPKGAAKAELRPSRFLHAPLFSAAVSPFSTPAQLKGPFKSLAPAPAFWTTPRKTSDVDTTPGTAHRDEVGVTRLDEVGRLASHIPPALVGDWKQELATHPTPKRAALLHLWLGEWQLGQNQQPVTARRHFRQAQHLLPYSDPLYGLAAYDSAISLFYEGDYSDASEAFSQLLSGKGNLKYASRGYDRLHCSLWLRHADACAGYHAERARLGIPEPRSLDPFCGVASLAACLKALALPSDKSTLLKACRVSGEGSNLADLVAAGPKLGVSVRAFSADEQGLKLLPKPLVAYVEHDHFVAVVRADKAGVSYLCSDCGSGLAGG